MMSVNSLQSIGWPDPFPEPLIKKSCTKIKKAFTKGHTKKNNAVTFKIIEDTHEIKLFDEKNVFVKPRDDVDDESLDLSSCISSVESSLDSDSSCEYLELKDKQWKRKHTYNLIYKKKIYELPYSPVCIYIPTKEVMFKLMRACIGVNFM